MHRKKKKLRVRQRLMLCLVFALWMLWGNFTVDFSSVDLAYASLPEEFDGFVIAQVSDFHNSCLGNGVIRRLKQEQPDLIAITGDLVDANHTDMDLALDFVAQLVQIAPCCYVSGNHESWLSAEDFCRMEHHLAEMDVVLLKDETELLSRGDAAIALTGLSDPAFGRRLSVEEIDALSPEGMFTLLLSHRPESFDVYVGSGADLTLSGHVHGGQFRLPLIGGVIGPYYTFLPDYDAGVYRRGEQAMVVSRGIGNSVVPVRFNNRPEVVMIRLQSK